MASRGVVGVWCAGLGGWLPERSCVFPSQGLQGQTAALLVLLLLRDILTRSVFSNVSVTPRGPLFGKKARVRGGVRLWHHPPLSVAEAKHRYRRR